MSEIDFDKAVVFDAARLRPVSGRAALETTIGCGFDASRCMPHLTFAIVRSLSSFLSPKSYDEARQREGKANASKGGGGWAQLLLIVKRRIKKGEEKALGGWMGGGGWVGGGQRKRREK